MEVKYLLFFAIAAAFLFFILGTSEATHFSVCSPSCNTTVVWWNDTVNVTGIGGANDAVTARIDRKTACTTTTSSTGHWNCTFLAPHEVGKYNLSVTVGSTADESTLMVRPTYGFEPVGTLSRFVFEIPFLVQEPSGVVRSVLVRLTVSKGPSGTA